MMKKSEGQSIIEAGKYTKVNYSKICLTARELQHLKTEMSTKDTLKMARRTDLVSTLSLEGPYMTVAGKRIKSME